MRDGFFQDEAMRKRLREAQERARQSGNRADEKAAELILTFFD